VGFVVCPSQLSNSQKKKEKKEKKDIIHLGLSRAGYTLALAKCGNFYRLGEKTTQRGKYANRLIRSSWWESSRVFSLLR
jgi:hypothetical protein